MKTIVKTTKKLPLKTTGPSAGVPVLPLRNGVLLPGSIMTVSLVRPEEADLIRYCQTHRKELLVSHSPEAASDGAVPVSQVGVMASICHVFEAADGLPVVTLEGIRRAVLEEITAETPLLLATVNEIELSDDAARIGISEIMACFSMTRESETIGMLRKHAGDNSLLIDRISAVLNLPAAARQELLETVDLKDRLALLESFQKTPVPVSSVDCGEIGVSSDSRRESNLADAARIRALIAESSFLPGEVAARATHEVDRLAQLPTASAEYGATKFYLDWLLSLPWGKCSGEEYDIAHAEKILTTEYYGPASLKEQILQRLSVRKLQRGAGDAPTLCFIGAPGTGKASLAKAIAHALGKELIRISVGGITDVGEVKGMPRTFLAALPGKIIRSLRNVKSCDPVVLLEDVDYFNLNNDASVNMAMLEAIDTRRNARFLDNYLGIPFDLSKIFFICSVRSFEEIPEQFIPRLEIIELPGYTEKEKRHISKRYLIPNLLNRLGLTKAEVKFTDQALTRIVTSYTQEAGLLSFSQNIEKICRRIALEKLQKPKKSWTINDRNLESYLGPAMFFPERAEAAPEIGTAAGLAWTGAGGELMFIEGLKMKGSGDIITTGSLGEVMRESIQAAHSYVRSKADMLGIDFSDFNDFDIHVHFPSGAIPKDGPSAGVTVCLVIASVMSERPIRNDIAMTGEVTLRGRVLRVAGIKEKISAAHRSGIYHVAMPQGNQKDIKELPREMVRKMKFTFIERVDELFETCLLDFTPSSYSLEKVFAEEIRKVKRKKGTPPRKQRTPRVAKRK